MTTVVTLHQPDLLPYTGFWHKMAHSDVFVVLAYDQFQKQGYQRRVKMRGSWVGHQLVGKPSLIPICDVEVHDGWQARLINDIRGRYQGSRYWDERGPELCGAIEALPEFQSLHRVNMMLIRLMRDRLGLLTQVEYADPHVATKGVYRVIDHVLRSVVDHHHHDLVYLAGQGSRVYMEGSEALFADHGIDLRWSQHLPRSEDSILTAYFDEDDPMEAVLA